MLELEVVESNVVESNTAKKIVNSLPDLSEWSPFEVFMLGAIETAVQCIFDGITNTTKEMNELHDSYMATGEFKK